MIGRPALYYGCLLGEYILFYDGLNLENSKLWHCHRWKGIDDADEPDSRLVGDGENEEDNAAADDGIVGEEELKRYN